MQDIKTVNTPSGTNKYLCSPTNYIIKIKEIKLHKTDPINTSYDKDNGTRIYYNENDYDEYDIVSPIELEKNYVTVPPREQFDYVSILIKNDIKMNITAQFKNRDYSYFSKSGVYNGNQNLSIKTTNPAEDFILKINHYTNGSFDSVNDNDVSEDIKAILLDKDNVPSSSPSSIEKVFIRFKNNGGPLLILNRLNINFETTRRTYIESSNWGNWISASPNDANKPFFKTLPFVINVSV